MSDRARNSIRGRQAKAAGDALEDFLNVQHEKARYLGILACIDKIDPPAVVRNGRVEFGPKTVSDYIGMFDGGPFLGEVPKRPSGQYVAIEAKSTLKEYLPRSMISKLQQEHQEATARGGGLALLVVEFRSPPDKDTAALIQQALQSPFWRGRIYACPWPQIPWQKLRTAESVAEADLFRGGRAVSRECYLERWHPRGTPSTPPRGRVYARE